jgi:hypothetical protein
MRYSLACIVFLLSLFSAPLCAQEPLNNETILKLVKAGIGEDTIVGMVNQQPGKYSLADADVAALKTAGVSEKIIAAMIVRGGASNAQPTPAPAPTIPNPPAPQAPLVLQDSTPVRLRLSRNLSSADAQVGETVDFEVLDDLKVDDLLLAPRGGTAIATVTEAQSKRRMARGGKLDVNIDYVRLVNGEKVALRAVKEAKGGGHTGAMTGGIVATSIIFFPAAPFFLFMHGKDVTIPKGTEITAYVNGEIKLDRSKFPVGTPARLAGTAMPAPPPIAPAAPSPQQKQPD